MSRQPCAYGDAKCVQEHGRLPKPNIVNKYAFRAADGLTQAWAASVKKHGSPRVEGTFGASPTRGVSRLIFAFPNGPLKHGLVSGKLPVDQGYRNDPGPVERLHEF